MGFAVFKFLGSLTATVIVYGAYRVLKNVYREVTSPLRDLPGPDNPSFVYGNMKQQKVADRGILHESWIEQYGSTIQYKSWFSRRRLLTSDTKALTHILTNTHIYEKAPATRYNLARIIGNGVLVVEGEKHKHQRKVMNPAFGPIQVRELTAIFVNKAIELRDVWLAEIDRQGSEAHVDGLSWLSRATLDIIGLAGFKYKFDALTESREKNELSAAFARVMEGGTKISMILMLRTYIPALRVLKIDDDVRSDEAKRTMSRIGQELLQESKKSIHEKVEQRDLLTLMVKSNMAGDLPEHQRMSDQDVLAQVPTFLVAGHETTSTATTWMLYALTQNKAAQEKLREELLTVDTDTPTMEQLNALPYLDMVVRESMRLHSPIANTMRTAVQDDIIDLAKPFTDRKGVSHNTIRITKGQTLLIPIAAINRDKTIWGDDAPEFRPERWENVPEDANRIPGVWGNILTFLGGPRACIGYRFSLVETKALLFTLVRAFEFDLAVPATHIIKKSAIVQRPVLVTDGRNQTLPLIIRPISRT